MSLPPSIRVLSSPRRVFREVADRGVGFGNLFGLLALELLIARPGDVTTHLMRLGAAPLGGLTGLWSTYVAWAVKPALTLFILGVGLYYHLRRTDRRLEVWAAASVLSYAWVPHVLLVALGTVIAWMGWDHPILPQHGYRAVGGPMVLVKQLVEFGPTAVLIVVAAVTCRNRATGAQEASTSESSRRAAWGAAATAAVLVAAGLTVGAARVTHEWDTLRPILPNDPVPAFTVTGLDGRRITDQALANRVTLIDFWATWCRPCVAAMPHLESLHRELAPRGLMMLSVNTEPDNIDGVRRFAEETGLTFPIYIDGGAMQQRFRVQTYPTALVVDGSGVVRHLHVGSTSMVTLRNEIEALLTE